MEEKLYQGGWYWNVEYTGDVQYVTSVTFSVVKTLLLFFCCCVCDVTVNYMWARLADYQASHIRWWLDHYASDWLILCRPYCLTYLYSSCICCNHFTTHLHPSVSFLCCVWQSINQSVDVICCHWCLLYSLLQELVAAQLPCFKLAMLMEGMWHTTKYNVKKWEFVCL